MKAAPGNAKASRVIARQTLRSNIAIALVMLETSSFPKIADRREFHVTRIWTCGFVPE